MATQASGRFLLRVPPSLHRVLQSGARACDLSLNEYCVRRLAVGGSGLAVDDGAVAVVAAAADIVGAQLVAVIVYGSWVRGEATAISDVDALIVVDPEVSLTRSLYRTWDKVPMTWHGRPVDPHFVHPPVGRIEGGVWGEAALDGVVVFERDWQVSTELANIRRSIAAGRLVRRYVHGQPYWTVAA